MTYVLSHAIVKSNFSYFCLSKNNLSLGKIYTWRLIKLSITKDYSEQIWSNVFALFVKHVNWIRNTVLHKESANHPNSEKFKVLPIVF